MVRRILLLLLLTACASDAPPEFGVDVFSNDTTPVKFIVTLTGSLSMALRSNNFYLRPDKSLVLETPAQLIVKQGAGTAVITAWDSTSQVAVESIGAAPDSSDTAVIGHDVRVTRVGEEKRVSIELQKR